MAPLAPRRFALQVTIDQDTHDKLCRLQDLLGPQIPSGDVAQVLERAFDALLEKLTKAKFAATGRPRQSSPPPSNRPRYVPAAIRRQVWERDGGRCTFMSDAGQRCPARKFLEYDHVEEVARGGGATAGNLRLRCRAHNQYAAERTFGLEFMRAKREAARAGAGSSARTCTGFPPGGFLGTGIGPRLSGPWWTPRWKCSTWAAFPGRPGRVECAN